MKQQTAVEYFLNAIKNQINLTKEYLEMIESYASQAKEMEKNQIIKAFTRGYLIGEDESFPIETAHKAGQKYYDEIIKTK